LSVSRRILEPELCAATSSSSCSSFSARTKSPADSGLKVTAALPAGRRPSSVASVTCAVESANSWSVEASLSFLRPNSVSNRPTSR
jgi:hypothetical protein